MQYLYIYYFGPIKDSSISALVNSLLRRLKRVKCIELQSPKAVVGAQDSQLKEKEIIEKRVFEKHDYIIVCRERGDEFSSQSLYSHIKKLDREIAIVISGAFGPHKSIVDNSNLCLSLSKLTFTHEMALYILLEQCYRLECFDTNKEYSK